MNCTVREAQARVDSAEFAEWMAWERIEHEEPIGVLGRLEHMLAELCAMTFNINRSSGVSPAKPSDFQIKLIGDSAAAEMNDVDLDAKISQSMRAFTRGGQ